jgi:hypothetical protein
MTPTFKPPGGKRLKLRCDVPLTIFAFKRTLRHHITMVTPSGRFQPNTRLCLSMTDYHPESWNPMWSVSSILAVRL